jgi:flavodoxin
MKAAVRYYSKSGNTKKLADAIAKAVGTEAKTIEEPISEAVDVLFLGGAVYAGNPDNLVKSFVENLTPETVKAVAVFGTAAGGKSIQPKIAELISAKGIEVVGKGFVCKGKFLLANKGRPNEQDCADAVSYAKQLLNI